MPFYEYECSSCKFYSEVLQKISDKPFKKCPSCGKQTFKRLISAPVFRLKGGGWYETDFKSDGEKKRNLAGSEEAPKSDDSKAESKAADTPKAEAKSESKSEGKSEGKSEARRDSSKSSKPVSRPKAKKPSKPAPKAKKKSKR
jgi:putative FmdB family regulatory protein